MQLNPGGELDPAVAARILLPFYQAKIRRQKKAMTMAAKPGQFTVGEAGKGQLVSRNR